MDDKADKEFTYLLETYRAAVDYFNGYSERYSNRFNIFLTIDVALAGLFANLWISSASEQSPNRGAYILIAFLGWQCHFYFTSRAPRTSILLNANGNVLTKSEFY
jgi:hypothetical protein